MATNGNKYNETDKQISNNNEIQVHNPNQHKIDMEINKFDSNAKGFTGMSKKEVMEYENNPYWVRLRRILLIGLCVIWLSMLAGAVLIAINTTNKCTTMKK